MSATLHITNGDAAAAVMRAAGIDGEILPWRDVLHEGPVSAALPLSELSPIRARFIADKGWADLDRTRAQFAARDRMLEVAGDFDRIVLWFEHDLYDQLQLLQLLSWFATHERGAARLELLCIGSYPRHTEFKGLGELSPDELAALQGQERPVTEAQLELAWLGFQAFGADAPERLVAFLRRDLTPLPYLRGALFRLLEEYPWQSDGLSRSHRQLLRSAPQCDGDLRRMFRACGEMEEARYLGDRIFLDYAVELATMRQPLLQFVDGDPPDDDSPVAWRRQVMLTAFGARVLAGAADFIAANGINRWLGGVHLMRDIWRYSPAAKMLLPTSL